MPNSRWVKADISHPKLRDNQFYNISKAQTLWDRLPIEIVLEILGMLPIHEVLSFLNCCQDFRSRFGNSIFLSSLLRGQMCWPDGRMYWFMPVSTVEGEVERFCEICRESSILGSNREDEPALKNTAIVFSRKFPLYDFVQANYRTESMRNRRRLWRISQQFRREWYRYRTKGYLDENAYKPDFPV
jgi:hypothetical protein